MQVPLKSKCEAKCGQEAPKPSVEEVQDAFNWSRDIAVFRYGGARGVACWKCVDMNLWILLWSCFMILGFMNKLLGLFFFFFLFVDAYIWLSQGEHGAFRDFCRGGFKLYGSDIGSCWRFGVWMWITWNLVCRIWIDSLLRTFIFLGLGGGGFEGQNTWHPGADCGAFYAAVFFTCTSYSSPFKGFA